MTLPTPSADTGEVPASEVLLPRGADWIDEEERSAGRQGFQKNRFSSMITALIFSNLGSGPFLMQIKGASGSFIYFEFYGAHSSSFKQDNRPAGAGASRRRVAGERDRALRHD